MSFLTTSLGSLAALALLSLTAAASAQAPLAADKNGDLVVATDPAPLPTAKVAVPLSPPTKPVTVAPETGDGPDEPGASSWYGDDVLIAAAITVPMMVGNAAAVDFGSGDLTDVGMAYGVLSTIAHLVTGPAIQAAADGDDAPYKIGTSAALRSGMLATSGTTALVICSATDTCTDGVLVGAVAAGAALPVLIETTFLSWKKTPDQRAQRAAHPPHVVASPYVAPTEGGAAVGIAGIF